MFSAWIGLLRGHPGTYLFGAPAHAMPAACHVKKFCHPPSFLRIRTYDGVSALTPGHPARIEAFCHPPRVIHVVFRCVYDRPQTRYIRDDRK